ncbi:MAG: ParB N-terminal domain-containing protein [Chloroflexi bacterium]|nr:ParB N-terminal domain-containing protein [Chloroflexota bacterium]
MLIPVGQIVADPAQQDRQLESKTGTDLRKGLSNVGTNQPVVVRQTNGGSSFMIVVGERRWRVASSDGHSEIECEIRDALSEQEIRELQLSESYHHETVPSMKMGRAFLEYRESFGISQQELARRTGITPGTIHHYESLVRNLAPDLGERVSSGELTFKEGRSIADIDGHDRQREIAEPFISGRLSSVYVEKIVGYAKKNPLKPVEQILEEVLRGTKAEERVQKEVVPAPRTGVDISKLEGSALNIAGELDLLPFETIPEYRRLNIISTLRILDSKVQGAISFLSTSQPRTSGLPRPLLREVRK